MDLVLFTIFTAIFVAIAIFVYSWFPAKKPVEHSDEHDVEILSDVEYICAMQKRSESVVEHSLIYIVVNTHSEECSRHRYNLINYCACDTERQHFIFEHNVYGTYCKIMYEAEEGGDQIWTIGQQKKINLKSMGKKLEQFSSSVGRYHLAAQNCRHFCIAFMEKMGEMGIERCAQYGAAKKKMEELTSREYKVAAPLNAMGAPRFVQTKHAERQPNHIIEVIFRHNDY